MINLSELNLSINDSIKHVRRKYQVIDVIDLNEFSNKLAALQSRLYQNYKSKYKTQQRIVVYQNSDYYNNTEYGALLKSLQIIINKVDISNFFIILITNNPMIKFEYQHILENYSDDDISFEIFQSTYGIFQRLNEKFNDEIGHHNVINLFQSNDPYVSNLLDHNKNFCIMPWIQSHVNTQGQVYPCCAFSEAHPLGNSKNNTLDQIFNNAQTRKLRLDMLSDKATIACNSCINTDKTRKMSHRKVANNRFLSHVKKTKHTNLDGSYLFKHIAWDIRFDNLCNLKCRTCSYIASTSWFNDTVAINNNIPIKQILRPPGIFKQLLQHVDNVEYIYFAGGEPLIIQKCWDILSILIERNLLDVELVYNTNFTKLDFKGISIFHYLKNFNNVHIGASLDAMGKRAEYWRSGTIWGVIEHNRRRMINEAPDISFSIDATVSLVNALHVMDFHKDWVEKNLIKPHQFIPKVLDTPTVFSLHQVPTRLKEKILIKLNAHIKWLTLLDTTEKSISGFKAIAHSLESNIDFDSSGFWEKINVIDRLRNERLISVFPELDCLPDIPYE